MLAPRSDFPIFSRRVNGHRLVYLDSGATSQRPRAVMDAMVRFDSETNGAVKRGAHTLAAESTLAFEDARATVAAFVGADPGEIVWTSGSTAALNLLAYACSNASLGRGDVLTDSDHAGAYDPALTEKFRLAPGDSIVTTRAEHHANLVPWQELAARTGATLRWLDLDPEGRIDPATLDRIDSTTKIVAFTHVSNVTGAVSPVAQIVAAAKAVGAITVLDACQSVPHMPVDVYALDVDFAVFSGHKMLGPTGIGGLYGRRELLNALPPFLTGGSMIKLVTMERTTFTAPPARFEAGTQPVVQAIGLAEAVSYLEKLGMENVATAERALTARTLAGMAEIPGVRVLGPADGANRTGIIAFTVDGVHPHDVGQVLDAAGVAIRTGHHCAQPIHAHFGVTASNRVSFGPYNDVDDVAAFLDALAGVRAYFGVEK